MPSELSKRTDRHILELRLAELNAAFARRTKAGRMLEDNAARAATETTSVGLVIIDRQHRYKFANDVYLRILGLTESMVGKTPAECLPPDYDNRTGPRLEKAFAGERA